MKNDTFFRKTIGYKNERRVAQDFPTHRRLNVSANKAAHKLLFSFFSFSSTTNTSLIQNGNVVERQMNRRMDGWMDGWMKWN
jgi:hypothetical protein